MALKSLNQTVLLPDGSEFKTWEATPTFTKTYYVDQNHPKASDENQGTRAKPFRTIGRAAEVLKPGERVVVAGGIYREHVRVPRGGTGPTRMISYEAAPDAKVILKGSEVFKEKWTPARPADGKPVVWQASIDPAYFKGYRPFGDDWYQKPTPEHTSDYNPFTQENLVLDTPDAVKYWGGLRPHPPFNLVRGLVFQEGKRLEQVDSLNGLTARPGRYWVDRERQRLHVRLFGDADPNQIEIEITTRISCFSGAVMGLGYIRIQGFVMEHTAGPFPVPQVGALSTWRGHHWIIEDNTIRHANGVGIDAGMQSFWGELKQLPEARRGRHIIRRNTVTDCGICGIVSAGLTVETLIEDNIVLRNAWHDAGRLPECGGIKTHINIRTLIRRNLVVDTYNGPGIWMDFGNEHSRCTRNVIVRSRPARIQHGSGLGAIFIEASRVPNLVDNNVVWDTEGNGIYEHDSIHQIFAHNFIGKSTGYAFYIGGGPVDRKDYGAFRLPAGAHKVRNNILVDNRHLYRIDGPRDVVGDLTSGVTARLDPHKLELTWAVKGAVPDSEKLEVIVQDFFGKLLGDEKSTPGPFRDLPAKPQRIELWPPGR